MRRLAADARLVAEPAGAVPFAAYLHHASELEPASYGFGTSSLTLTGETTTDDILGLIFSTFCIGK